MFNIEDITLKQAREVLATFRLLLGGERKTKKVTPLPFGPGDAILIRTVTMIQLGRVTSIGNDFIVLEGGGWVADTGRFSELLAGKWSDSSEFERAPSWMLIGRGAIVDVFPWTHAIPEKTK
jgi:hypothetical protein